MKKLTTLFALICFYNTASSQCPVVTCPSSCTITCNSPATVTATSNYSANITSIWLAPGNVPVVSAGTATSVININAAADYSLSPQSTYTVQFTDNVSGCVSQGTINVVSDIGKPLLSLTSPSSFSEACTNSPVTISLTTQTSPAGGAVLFAVGAVGSIPSYSTHSIYNTTTCGDYFVMAQSMMPNVCISSYTVHIACAPLTGTLAVTPNSTICAGSGIVLTASGANSYTWSNGATTSSIQVTSAPSGTNINTTTNYGVVGSYISGGCTAANVQVTVDQSCRKVWPGDANSDGVVDNADIFEIGLAFSGTGTPRAGASNAYTGQYAQVWAGTVSNGENKCHADCNGDGLVNYSDTIAIYNNYALTHAFKTAATTANGDVTIVTPANVYIDGSQWNRADIMLGDANNNISQLYGLSFNIDFDKSLLENDSAYIIYTPSFLNAGNQNVQFRKTFLQPGRIATASVRIDGANVSGNGKIGELCFKAKPYSVGMPFNVSVYNVNKINSGGTASALNGGASALTIYHNYADPVGLTEVNGLVNSTSLFPNPAKGYITLQNSTAKSTDYNIIDITGREVSKGSFTTSKTFDLVTFKSGVYFVKFGSGNSSCYKKLIVE